MTLLSTYVLPGRLLHACREPNADAPAVVLFTSGSESTPKAVPLSHRNLVTNLRASLKVLQASRNDVLLGFLPPFHSFGLLANVLAPVLGGIRVAHYPDPTDAAGLVRTVAAYKTTIMVTTPTFLSYMFGTAGPRTWLRCGSLSPARRNAPRRSSSGPNRWPPRHSSWKAMASRNVRRWWRAICRAGSSRAPSGRRWTAWKSASSIPIRISALPARATGMLLVRGPSIFNGYLNYSGPDPFTEVDGKRWYVTGDLVRLDDDGYIHFCGRLKRFLKIGGEMVSLPALEEPLSLRYPPTEDGPQVAVEGVDAPGRWIVLFTTLDIALQQANAILAEAGLRGVMRLDAVERIEAIPVLGTGKTDYKVLRKLVAERV